MPTITFMEALRRKQDEKCVTCGFERKEHTYNGACYGICGDFIGRMVPRSVFWRYCHCGHVSGKTEQYVPCDACGKDTDFYHYRIEALK